ncbi:uncharacterized protein MYCFIDRAFT_156019 [Pseudocercospora fijiensis CIRAD86]|uniref:SnoaL-like domain-containing protein n=1 Tax=Pseudocercospora fijiensis (strain CIRAD86) TaxID=383855 RepID=M3ASW8_PSEFD|nr:uncharacterized protein MYCFIDRAFT_156019 [Pseudocercospora fijiensis CIRAD86]EME80223.1 hypothetical protein MYCFIDRAFT_156019 [Pseudocercospora fijiensis CIRAD86]
MGTQYASAVEGLTQAGYKASWTIDSKNWTALGEVMTKDIYYDSSSLGAYGGKSVGLDEVTAAISAAGKNAKTEHLVTNLYVKELQTPTKARVITYITWSHWVESALKDITKTFRIYYMCDDIWVIQDGAWKMQHSIVQNMGYKAEAPYFG